MKKTLLTGVSLMSMAMTSAFAADLPARAPVYTKAPVFAPIYDWTGFYIGLNGGGRRGPRVFPHQRRRRRCGLPEFGRLPQRDGRAGRWPSRLSLADEFLGVRCR